MKLSRYSSANGLIGRADLLHLLATSPRPELWLDDDGEHQFGYQQRVPSPEQDQTGGTIFDPPPPKQTVQTGNFKLPLQMPFAHVIAERQSRELLTQAENTGQTVTVYEPFGEDDDPATRAPEQHRLISYQKLVPKARLLPALKRYVSGNRTLGLDVPMLVKQIAGQQLPRHLPRRQIKTWHPQWVVVLDFAKRLWPYRQDMHQLAEHLLHACGQSGVSIRIINHGPLQHWTDWVEEQRTGCALPVKHAWRMPPSGTPVLLVSDLGLLEGSESADHQVWQGFIRQLGKARTQPLALLPLCTEQLDAGLPNQLTLLRWSPDARIHPERAQGNGQAVPEGLKELLAMASVTRRVDPPLLRAMRRLNPKAPLNAGLEGAFWCHADVEAGSAANIRNEAQAKHLAHFAQLLDDSHIKLEQLRYRHHAHLRAVLNHEEAMMWRAHVELDDAELAPETLQRLAKADSFMRQLASTLKQADGLQKGGIWWSVAQDIVQRADNQMGEHYRELLAPLVQAIVEVRGNWQQMPDWVDPVDLVDHSQRRAWERWLVCDPVAGGIYLQPTPPSDNQSALTGPLLIDQGGLRLESVGSRLLLSIRDLPYRLCGLQDEAMIKLTSSVETLTLTGVKRPRGAAAWGYDTTRSGLSVRSASLCGKSFEWSTSSTRLESFIQPVWLDNDHFQLEQPLQSNQVNLSDTAPTYFQYEDGYNRSSTFRFALDRYGVRADLTIILPVGKPIQSFRWIEPGTFWMGSPDDEAERNTNEGPQHEVTITQGFWLADTACTKALWQAVMDNNPSRFKDDPNQPVEKINWHQVQEFIQRLQVLLPGCQVDLPSEAEWEYACRAGTDTPFSFGATISPHQVNYDGNSPYAGGKRGEYRGKTVPVKTLSANSWGLYEMHGNVDEWCKDGQRNYDEHPKIDPLGPLAGTDLPRVVRGGSWSHDAWGSRSAYRDALQPGFASDLLGFRFCLRSIQSGQEQVSPAGTPGGASQEVAENSATSSESGLISKLGAFLKRGPKPKRRS